MSIIDPKVDDARFARYGSSSFTLPYSDGAGKYGLPARVARTARGGKLAMLAKVGSRAHNTLPNWRSTAAWRLPALAVAEMMFDEPLA